MILQLRLTQRWRHAHGSDFERVTQTLKRAREHLGEILSAAEFADQSALEFSRTLLKVWHGWQHCVRALLRTQS